MLFAIYRNIFKTHDIQPKQKFTEINMKSKDGYDNRYDNYFQNNQQLSKINRYLEIKKILDKLESNNINEIEKMNILNEYSFLFNHTMAPNILNGGLLDDFDFQSI